MFSQSLGRAARSNGPLIHASSNCSIAAVSRPATCAIGATARPRSGHARRHSSSKTSSPPGAGQRNPETPTGGADASRAQPEDKDSKPASRVPRRKSKDTVEFDKTRAEAFANVPAVQPTFHLREDDVKLSSFFAQHRPISISAPVPPTSTSSQTFASIFESKLPSGQNPTTVGQQQHKIQDVIYTLSNAVNNLQGPRSTRGNRSPVPQTQEERDLRYEILQQQGSEQGHTVHLDGQPSQQSTSLESLVSQFMPFNVPPPPVPMDQLREEAAAKGRNDRQKIDAARAAADAQAEGKIAPNARKIDQVQPTPRRTFRTTITIEEQTNAAGEPEYSARASPIIRVPTAMRRGKMGEPGRVRRLLTLSVKRQRKLKMKKHKYKKLMKRTRTLRRKLGRA